MSGSTSARTASLVRFDEVDTCALSLSARCCACAGAMKRKTASAAVTRAERNMAGRTASLVPRRRRVSSPKHVTSALRSRQSAVSPVARLTSFSPAPGGSGRHQSAAIAATYRSAQPLLTAVCTMRPLTTSLAVCIAAALQLLSINDAEANRSSFKVQDIQQSGDNYVITLSTNHFGAPAEAKFFAHTKTPSHSSSAVEKGVSLGTATTPTGAGQVTLTVSKAALEAAGLKAGATLHVAATWPKFGHNWGTDNTAGSSHWEGTSSKIPDGSKQAVQAEAVEQFPNGMPLLYSRPLWKNAKAAANGKPAEPGQAADPLAGPANTEGLTEAQR